RLRRGQSARGVGVTQQLAEGEHRGLRLERPRPANRLVRDDSLRRLNQPNELRGILSRQAIGGGAERGPQLGVRGRAQPLEDRLESRWPELREKIGELVFRRQLWRLVQCLKKLV